jgi:uncharacterized protein (TIGR03437 family)
MRHNFFLSVLLSTALVPLVLGQSGPVINPASVISAATFAPMGGPNQGLAQGSFIAIFGSNLGPANFVQATSFPIPTSLGGSSVTITPATGSPVQAYIDFVFSGQINAILPSNTPLGPANVTVTYNNQTSPPIKINVVASSFGIFTAASGSGPAATINFTDANAGAEYHNYFTNAANPGQTLELYGTGLGPVGPGLDNNPPGAVIPANVSVQVLVGGTLITPFYAGRSPTLAGVDQINFTLPSDGSLPASCFVPIAIVVNGVTSNFGTLATAASGLNCPAPFGLVASQLANLENGGTLNAGFMNLSSITTEVSSNGFTGDATVQQAGAIFSADNAYAFLGLSQTLGGTPPVYPAGSCVVETINSPPIPTSATPPVTGELNAGASLQLTGPVGKSASLPFASTGYTDTVAQSNFGSPAPTFIAPGSWTMTGTGGPDLGAFSATITVPTALSCTNCGTINTITRSTPLTINWTGGGSSQDWVQIGGISTAPLIADTTKNVAVVFQCAAHATDRTFTVPANILSQLPAAPDNPLASTFGTLVLTNVLNTNNSFTAPLKAGGNLDLAFFNYSSVFLRVVGFQ